MTDLERHNELLPSDQGVTESESRHVQDILSSIAQNAGMFRVDRDNIPLRDAADRLVPTDYTVVRGGRFAVHKDGRVYRYFPKGSPKDRRNPTAGGAPRRFSGVEMWTGKWRPCVNPATGKPTYAKNLVICPVEKHVGGNEHMSGVEWAQMKRGWKHPFDLPDSPTAVETRAMDRRRANAAEAVYAKVDELPEKGDLTGADLRGDAGALDYPALQARAKALGIPCNQGKVALLEAVRQAEADAAGS